MHIGMRIGDSVTGHTVVGITVDDFKAQANATTDCDEWIQVNYSDTVHMRDVLLQTGTKGITTQVPGHPPSTLFRAVTGLKLSDIDVDLMSSDGIILKQTRDAQLIGCNVQGAEVGIRVHEQAQGTRIRDCCLQVNSHHGIVLSTGGNPSTESCKHTSISGCDITDNGSGIPGSGTGIAIEGGVYDYRIVDNFIGNGYELGSPQAYAIYASGATDRYVVKDNVFFANTVKTPDQFAQVHGLATTNPPTNNVLYVTNNNLYV